MSPSTQTTEIDLCGKCHRPRTETRVNYPVYIVAHPEIPVGGQVPTHPAFDCEAFLSTEQWDDIRSRAVGLSNLRYAQSTIRASYQREAFLQGYIAGAMKQIANQQKASEVVA
jgi:hypothetical protein